MQEDAGPCKTMQGGTEPCRREQEGVLKTAGCCSTLQGCGEVDKKV